MTISALLWAGGFFISSIAIHFHLLALLFAGYGIVGGIGLGIGYISPVSTLLKWFPRSPGKATGLAIGGFGGGALIGSNLAVELMQHFPVDTTFFLMGCIYLVTMLTGACVIRIPEGVQLSEKQEQTAYVPVEIAWKTPQFWLIWTALLCNVSAGIGLLEQASPFIQEVILAPEGYSPKQAASAAAGFVGLLALANFSGRFIWSSLSDTVGRKTVYCIFLVCGSVMFFGLPMFGSLTIGACCMLLTFYGGGFGALPAYLKDLFGTKELGAIHGRVLTGWSLAGVVGPTLINYLRINAINHGAVGIDRYTTSFELISILLIVGAICNLCIKRVSYQLFLNP
jgi:MFS family permease